MTPLHNYWESTKINEEYCDDYASSGVTEFKFLFNSITYIHNEHQETL